MTAKLRIAQAAFTGLLGLTWWLGHHDLDAAPPTTPGSSGPFVLRDVAAEVGIDFRHEPFEVSAALQHIDGQISATGAGVSLVDVDDDGWLDIYTTTSRAGAPNALYRNRGDGTFEDIAAAAGLADLNVFDESACQGSIWADVDADGDRDVFVYGYGRNWLMLQEPGLTFRDATAGAGLAGVHRNTNAACFFDYDRDGHLDLYIAGYWRDEDRLSTTTNSRVMHASFEFAQDGGSNVLYRNRGDGTFEDVTERTGMASTRWTYALAAADFNDDGFIDLYLANDYGSEELLLNQGGERFEKRLGAGLEEGSKSGMSVTLGDPENQGRLSVFVTNISEARYLFQGNNLRPNLLAEAGELPNFAEGSPVENCGWAWGAQFADLDLDGWQDLFVANGMISADPDGDYWYDMSKVSGALGGVIADAANWPPIAGRSLSGHQRSHVLRNQGRGRFREVGAHVGVDDTFDGRAVAVGDLFGDGTPDVVVANQRGPLLVYRSETPADRHWAVFDLRGAAPNRDAVGATVLVTVGEHVQRHVVMAGSGFCAQNDRRVHVGLGAAERVDRVEVRWPSGAVQLVEDLAVDRVHVLEEVDG